MRTFVGTDPHPDEPALLLIDASVSTEASTITAGLLFVNNRITEPTATILCHQTLERIQVKLANEMLNNAFATYWINETLEVVTDGG